MVWSALVKSQFMVRLKKGQLTRSGRVKGRLVHDATVVVDVVVMMMVHRVGMMMILQWRRLYSWHHGWNASLTGQI